MEMNLEELKEEKEAGMAGTTRKGEGMRVRTWLYLE
jgi:hypothetical protein